jgi:hypothetical protein
VSADTEAHIVTDEREEILATYNLCIVGTRQPHLFSLPGLMVLLDRLMEETEENLSDLMPDGLRVVIREWSSDE